MDSLTQIALGAAVGAATAGHQVGRRALLWGAICGTFPDLDVFIPMGDAVRNFTYHRGASHSIFVLAALTPLFVWLILKIHPSTSEHRWRWAALVYMVFATHALLDSFTVYGTQILWPFSTTPVTWSTIFIIDPLYTLPLLVGVIAVYFASRRENWRWGYKANMLGLLLSTGYLLWTVGAKMHVEQVAQSELDRQQINTTDVLTVPSPFNSLLWRVLAVNESDYYEGYYSVLDEIVDIKFDRYPRHLGQLDPLKEHWPVRRLQWFCKNFYAVSLEQDDIVMTDLRMGSEPNYVFRFKVGEIGNPHAHAVPPERATTKRDFSQLFLVWERLLNPRLMPVQE